MINSKYFRVPKKKEPLQEHEIHLTSKQDLINFLKYAIFLFEKRNLPYIKFKASGSAIAGLVNISEILKKVVPGVHQVNRIYTLKYEQDYEPKEKGLDHVTIVRNVPILEISFYKELIDLDMEKWPGYQAALKPNVFDRVKINFNNVIRKRVGGKVRRPGAMYYRDTRSTYSVGFRGQKKSYYDQQSSRGGFKPGFRGGRGRGGGGRGRGGRGFRGNQQSYQQPHSYNQHQHQYQNQYQHHTGQQYQGYQQIGKHHDIQSEISRGSSIRGFGRYRSKFDTKEAKH